jgi:hypothetical protein
MSIAGGVIVCLLSTHWSAMLFASDATAAPADTQSRPAPLTLDGALGTTRPLVASAAPAGRPLFTPLAPEFTASGRQVYRGRPYRMRHDGSIAAIMIGAAAAIAGTAVLVRKSSRVFRQSIRRRLRLRHKVVGTPCWWEGLSVSSSAR